MQKNTLSDIINDLKSRRDALSLCHEHLKHDSDQWNKFIIICLFRQVYLNLLNYN